MPRIGVAIRVSTRSVRHRRDRRRWPPRHRGARAHGVHHGPSRPGWTADVVGRAGGPGLPTPRDHRPRRAVDAAAAPRFAGTSSSTARSTTTSSCATSSRVSATCSSRRGTARFSCTPGPSGGRTRSTGSTGCSPSRSGTTSSRELVCACDRFGEKPLYWARDGERLVFASDVAAVLQARPDLGTPRSDALGPYLGRGLMPPVERELLRRGTSAPGGAPPPPGRRTGRGATVLAPESRRRPVAATRTPPSGCASFSSPRSAFGSAPMSRSAPRSAAASTPRRSLHCRRRWPATTAATRSPPASPASRETSGATPTMSLALPQVVEHHAVEPTAAGLLADLDALVASQQEPVGSSSVYAQWCVMRAAREAGVTVLLDGQGADELLGGYPGANGWALRSAGPLAVMRGLVSTRDRGDIFRAIGSERTPSVVARRHRRTQVTPYAARGVSDAAARVIPPQAHGDGLQGPLARELLRQSFHTSLPRTPPVRRSELDGAQP